MTLATRYAPLFLSLTVMAMAVVAVPPSAKGGGGPTYVAGEVAGVWTPDASPYVVVRDARVADASSLSIGPEVEVRFNPGTSLVVMGSLTVQGSDLGPVRFTANESTVGSWRGILVKGSAAFSSVSIESAETGIEVTGGRAYVRQTSVVHGRVGISVNRSSVAIEDSSFSRNEVAGGEFISCAANLTRVDFTTNGWAVVLSGASISIENGSLDGSALGDADLVASHLALVNTTRTGVLQLHDRDSLITERWFAQVVVTDAFGSPVAGASVAVNGSGLPEPILRATDADGWARWIDLAGKVTAGGEVTTPTYTFAATFGANTATRVSGLAGETKIGLPLSADLTPPVADAGQDITVAEDLPVTLDASRSVDNDPGFPAGASFEWRFNEIGSPIILRGSVATRVFSTPGTYAVLLEVRDAAGNSAVDLLIVRVLDATPPTATIAPLEAIREGDPVVLDARDSTDNDPSFNETGNFTWTVESGGSTRTLFGRTATFAGLAGDYVVTLRTRDAGGNADLATATLGILPRPSLNVAWVVAAVIGWFGALGIAGTERGRMAFLSWFVLPLYTRMKKDEVLDQFTRGQIYGYIVVHPGDSYVDIKRNLQLNNGTLTHHLNVLERDGLIRSKNVGTRKLFFAGGARVPEDGGGMHEVQQQILRHLRESGGLAVNDVAGVIGISRQLAIYHLRGLSRQGLVRIERRRFRIVVYAEGPPPTG